LIVLVGANLEDIKNSKDSLNKGFGIAFPSGVLALLLYQISK